MAVDQHQLAVRELAREQRVGIAHLAQEAFLNEQSPEGPPRDAGRFHNGDIDTKPAEVKSECAA